MQGERDAKAKLKAACFDYYTTQQLLAKAEDEHLQLRSIEQQLLQRIADCTAECDRLKHATREVDEDRKKEATLPAGVPVAAFDAFVAEERRLLAAAAEANDSMDALQAECAQLEADLIREGRSACLLEESLESQCSFSAVLIATSDLGGRKIEGEVGKQSSCAARVQMLQKELQALRQREATLKKALRFGEANRQKSRSILQDRDNDVMRLRRDAAFSRRLHLAELEHAREQEAELHRLTSENRQLREMVQQRREGRPTLHRGSGGGHETSMAADSGLPGAQMHDAKGRVKNVRIESTDELENFQRNAAILGKGKLVEKYREMNVALLQQVVSTMQALRVAVEPVPTSH